MKSFIFLVITFLCLQTAFAQGYGYPQQRRNNPNISVPSPSPSYSEEKKDAATVIGEQMPFFAKELQLDDFEKEIFKQLLTENLEKRESLRTNLEMGPLDKQDMFLKLEAELAQNLKAILSPEDIEKFKNLKLPKTKGKKKKKRKKSRKDKKDKGAR